MKVEDYAEKIKSVDFSDYKNPNEITRVFDKDRFEKNRKVAFILFVLAILTLVSLRIEIIVFGCVLALIGLLCYFHKPQKIIEDKKEPLTKEAVMHRLCNSINFKYNKKGTLPLVPKFHELELVPDFEGGTIQDQIVGSIDGVNFELQEAYLYLREDGKVMEIKYDFNGLLIRFDFPKKMSGLTILNRRSYEQKGFSEISSQLDRIKLEDAKFSKKFYVEATDQIEARYMLTLPMMENINKLFIHDKIDGLGMAFVDQSLYVAIETRESLFEGKPMYSYKAIEIDVIIKDMLLLFNIIDDLGVTNKTKV